LRSFARSNALYERALKTIPLASQTFSKSAMMHVRGAAPLFLERGAGGRVWDVDGNEYLDLVLGLLPVVLGYADPDVDEAIRAQLGRGVTFSLGTELEIELAETLGRLIPCAEMVRYGKNGSDATSGAVRVARAFTGRERIACCGYHGWHDWYIGTTSRDLGVPKAVRELTATFPYNDAEGLDRLLRAHPGEFAAVIMEPTALTEPAPGFLDAVAEATRRAGAVLIFDEIVTGFRLHMGGAQAHYGVTPDLACFGKAMANGMPISALVGRAEVMRSVEDIFFSGTFGGEALSLAAALATLAKLDRTGAVAAMHAAGRRLKREMAAVCAEHGLAERIRLAGADWWPFLSIQETPEVSANLLTSLLRQEAAEHGLLMLGTVNLCLANSRESEIEELLARWRRTVETVADHLRSNDPRARLRGEPIQPVFKVR